MVCVGQKKSEMEGKRRKERKESGNELKQCTKSVLSSSCCFVCVLVSRVCV